MATRSPTARASRGPVKFILRWQRSLEWLLEAVFRGGPGHLGGQGNSERGRSSPFPATFATGWALPRTLNTAGEFVSGVCKLRIRLPSTGPSSPASGPMPQGGNSPAVFTLGDLEPPPRGVPLVFQGFRGRLLPKPVPFHQKCRSPQIPRKLTSSRRSSPWASSIGSRRLGVGRSDRDRIPRRGPDRLVVPRPEAHRARTRPRRSATRPPARDARPGRVGQGSDRGRDRRHPHRLAESPRRERRQSPAGSDRRGAIESGPRPVPDRGGEPSHSPYPSKFTTTRD